MDFAKRKLRDIIDFVQRTSPGDRLGIVLFAGESYLYCPLTSDYSVLKTFANSIAVGLVSSGGSAITQALVTAANSFSNTKAIKPAVILISDGEDNEMVTQRSLDVLRGFKLRLWALGVGTPEGKPIELRGGVLLKDAKGQIVVTKLNEDALRALAQGSGGEYRRATIDDSDLISIFGDIARKVEAGGTGKDEASVRVYHEYGALLLWIPLLIIPLVLLTGRRQLVFALGFVCLAVSGTTHAQEDSAGSVSTPEALSLYDAQSAYARGDYETARRAFAHYHNLYPADSKITRGLASSEYRLGSSKVAAKLFSELAENAQTGRERFNALYDKGTSELAAKSYAEAVTSLEKALTIKPDDQAAHHNLELARKLEAEKKQKEQKQDPKEDQNQQKNSEQQDQKKEQQQQQEQQSEEQKQEQEQQQEEQKKGEKEEEGSDPQEKDQQEKPEEQKQEEQDDSNAEGSSEKQDENGQEQSAEGAKDEENTEPGKNAGEEAKDGTKKPDSSGASEEDSESSDKEETADGEENQGDIGQELPQHDPKALKEREARSWLESLDDSPVLLRRQVGNKRSTQQQSW